MHNLNLPKSLDAKKKKRSAILFTPNKNLGGSKTIFIYVDFFFFTLSSIFMLILLQQRKESKEGI